MAPPRQKSIRKSDERRDTEHSRDHHARNAQAEPRAVRDRVQRVGGLLLVMILGDHRRARRQRSFGLLLPEFRDRQTGRDAHDARREQALARQLHTERVDVSRGYISGPSIMRGHTKQLTTLD